MLVDHLHNVDHLLAQLLAHFLPADLSLLLVGQVDNIDLDAPDLPGNTLIRERPAGLFFSGRTPVRFVPFHQYRCPWHPVKNNIDPEVNGCQ